MADRKMLYSIIFEGINNGLLQMFKQVEEHIEKVNTAVKDTARYREYAQNLAMIGGGMVAVGVAGAMAIKSMVEPAMEMQGEMAHVATAINDGIDTTKHLNEARAMADTIAAKSVVTNQQLAESYYIARSNMLGHKEALDAVRAANDLVIGTTKNAADAQAQMVETTRTLTTLVQNFGGPAQHYADLLAKLQTTYAFSDISEVTYGLQYAMPIMKVAGVTATDAAAALALLSAGGLHGQEAGTAFQEMVSKFTTDRKLIPFLRRTAEGGFDIGKSMEAMKNAFGGMTKIQFAERMKGLGFGERDIRGLGIMMDKVQQYNSTLGDMQHSEGAAAIAAEKRRAALDEQFAMFQNNRTLFKEALGTPLLGSISSLSKGILPAVQAMTAFAEKHQTIVKYVMTFAAIGSAAAIAAGSLALLGAGYFFTKSYIPMLKIMVSDLNLGATATKVWTAAQWLFNTAMDANPIMMTVLAVAALAAGAYELYQHWDMVKGFFVGIWHSITSIDWKGAGWGIVKSIASGLLGGIPDAIAAAWKVGKVILDHFKGHSPPPLGPLHELGNLNLVQTIATSLKPTMAMESLRKLATTMALAVPIIAAPAVAAASIGSRSAPIEIRLHHEVEIKAAAGASVDADKTAAAIVTALKKRNPELAKAIGDQVDAELQRRARKKY